jgi:predicted RND superfamily exporter protein
VHIFNVFLLNYGNGMNKRDALASSLALNMYPIFLTSVTTAFGFLTMNFSESPPFRELGTISAIGVLGALWGSLFILPGLIMLMPFKRHHQAPRLHGLVAAVCDFVIRNNNRVFYGMLALVLIALSALPRMELNDNPIGYFSKNTPVRQASEFVEDNLSGTQIIYYSLDTGRPDGILRPEFLNSTEKFTLWLRDQPEVTNVDSITDVLKRINQILHEDNLAWYQLPRDKSVAAQYFLMYEMSLPYGLDPGNQVSRDKAAMKISVTLKNQKSQGLIAFEDRVQGWFASELPALATRGASHSLSFARIGQRNIESMLSGSFVAVILISLSLILAFRSLRYGLLSFIPNLFPAMVTLGIWSALVTEVNMAASVVFSITLGIIVDDTIHFIGKYIEARRRRGLSSEDAVRYAFSTVGVALVTTSAILALGFLILALSDFTVNSTSGMLVATTITVAIVLDLLLLPTILLKFDHLLGNSRD